MAAFVCFVDESRIALPCKLHAAHMSRSLEDRPLGWCGRAGAARAEKGWRQPQT